YQEIEAKQIGKKFGLVDKIEKINVRIYFLEVLLVKLRSREAFYILPIILLLSGCTPKATLQESIFDEANSNIADLGHQDNEGYKLFYGSWEYVEVVSQHKRLGADDGYDSLLGERITYHPEYFEDSSGSINSPTYLVSLYPLNRNEYNQFFPEQIGLEELLPNAEYFSLVEIVNKPNELETNLNGFIIIIKDDSTIYAFDNNCIYRLERVGYINGYDSNSKPQYQERW
ncbi:hypothetical protein LJC58_10050, partial [Lachnospiraceae bacterium OttesenSCG-928-D06]|nr:hypothetical protein [Lachnospiraceae bacterium OttesenSCG-928-D06]